MSTVNPVQSMLARLKLRHLRVIQALGDLRSAARVAAHFHISPAAVSKTLAEVEELVGAPLFERGRRGMHPTEIGVEMLENAALVIKQIGRMAESLHAMREGTRGRLTVAFRTSSVHVLVAQAICTFRERYPNVDVTVVDGAVMDLVDQLEQGELDLLFAYDDPRFEREALLSAAVIAEQPLLIVTSPNHPFLRRKRIAAQELSELQWCLPSHGSRMQHHLNSAFRVLGAPPPASGVRVSDVSMTTQLMQAGHFLAVYPQQIARQLSDEGRVRVLPFKLDRQVEPVVAVWNAALGARPAATAFRNSILPRGDLSGGPPRAEATAPP
ncbi:LysR family transcriptional regulator [Variovorax ginsengisoli]|uniref:LysR family transcriptional regulator n=1 Tax=Variovorax ginsengisoli TaxID=363844 RepID=A0ABT8SCK3_9BURK|nr:LysR family transcriptional regulator [Variovorax ginsengisoli]MDN8617486.1 LysR family transcriptional regulator [Variovorax ginsengisoli]MDO1536656.1 LysR family transcriptional regulator [Variovorax ginsengisoli]